MSNLINNNQTVRMQTWPQDHETSEYWSSRARCFEEYSNWCRDLKLYALCTAPLAKLEAGARCLDLGGGSGWIARRDSKLSGRDWTVLDLCPDFERYVRPPVKFVVGDARAAPLGDATFDFILVRSLLHYVDAARVLAEANRLLTRKGCLAVAQKVATHSASDDAWFADFERLKNPRCRREWPAAKLRNILESAGFRALSREIYVEQRKVNVREWFGTDGRLPNPQQAEINAMLTRAPESVRKTLCLSFIGDVLSYTVHWAVFTLHKSRATQHNIDGMRKLALSGRGARQVA